MQKTSLIISQPGKRARQIDAAPLVSIGRAPDNLVCLAGDEKVSKYHAVIESRADGLWLKDLGSTNGTTVNGAPVAMERQLEIGDLVCVGGMSTVEVCAPATET